MLREAMLRDLRLYLRWFEEHRPHQSLGGRSPCEVFDGDGIERPDLSLEHPVELVVRYHEGRKELPIIELRKAA